MAYIYLRMEILMILVVPVGFACLYFDAKLLRHSALISTAGIILGELLKESVNWGFSVQGQASYIRIAVYILQFGIAIAILVSISKRADNMLANTHNFYENINNILSNAYASSQSLESAENTLLQGVDSLSGSTDNSMEILAEEEEDRASNTKVKAIISNLNKSMENAKEIIKYTQTMLKGPAVSKGKGIQAGDEVVRIEEYTKNSIELITRLAKYTDKIKGDLNLISTIVDESKLLSISAGAEAEKASTGSKGSVILAMKVEKLADESVESASHIQELLESIVNDAENTVKSVAETYEEVFKSLELINRTVETLIQWLMYKNIQQEKD
jgi:methyl-accepting chemotaxis protein